MNQSPESQQSESHEPNFSLAKTRAEMIATVLRYQGYEAAEQELEKIAGQEGDQAIMEIAPHLSSATVRGMTAEADVVKPALLHTAVGPEQFRGVFRRIGAKWSAAGQDDCDPYTLETFQEELKQFFCAFVLLQDDEKRRQELVGAILEESHGCNALVFATIHEKDFDEFIASDGKNTDVGDWREVIGILPFRFPESWERFKRVAHAAGNRAKNYRRFVHDVASEIYAVALADGGGEMQETEKADELFTPLS